MEEKLAPPPLPDVVVIEAVTLKLLELTSVNTPTELNVGDGKFVPHKFGNVARDKLAEGAGTIDSK